jgi:hypothetical protein
MITRDAAEFFRFAKSLPVDFLQAVAREVFLVEPAQFSLAEESARDNRYMQMQQAVDADKALQQHRDLAQALATEKPVTVFAGDAQTPDALFPNNVFATTNTRYIVGHMRHRVRQREAEREDIHQFFTQQCGYSLIDLRKQPGICELTGSLAIDRARGIGFCGLSERCDERGAQAMHEAFGLKASLLFELAEGEYHTNVVLAVLGGRAAIIAPDGFADAKIAEAIVNFYQPHAVVLDRSEKNAFAANAISITDHSVWMSQAAQQQLSQKNRQILADAGFSLRSIAMDEIEKAGGSLRCCVGECF